MLTSKFKHFKSKKSQLKNMLFDRLTPLHNAQYIHIFCKKRRPSLYGRILAAFGIFFLGLTLVMGIAAYFTAGNLSGDFLARRLGLVLQTLIEAEKHERKGVDSRMDARELVRAMDLDFFVGKQIRPQWTSMPDGLHIIENGNKFLLLKRLDDIDYALYGSAKEGQAIMDKIRSMLLACACLGLAATAILAVFLSKRLASPLQKLSASIENTNSDAPSHIPAAILERKDETGQLARALEAYQQKTLKLLEREKSFTSAASHELRTPLAVIAGAIEILEIQTADLEEARPTLERLARTTENMTGTVSALLFLARGEKQTMNKIDLASVLGRVLLDLAPDNPELRECGKNLPKKILTSRGIGFFISGNVGSALGNTDLAAITLHNLLENACIHGDGNKIYIEASRDYIQIRNKSCFKNNTTGGSGFGLLIARRACEKMNWRLTHKKMDNETIFRIDLLVGDA